MAAACGVTGLLGVTLLERLVPILPSYGLLVAIGIAAAGGAWSVPTALVRRPWAVSAMPCLLRSDGGARRVTIHGRGQVDWTCFRCLAVARRPAHRLFSATTRGALAFGSQLVADRAGSSRPPSPVSCVPRRRKFAVASVCGIALWNSMFIAVGYYCRSRGGPTNVSTLALWILVIIVVGEGFAVAVWRRSRRRMIRRSPLHAAMPKQEGLGPCRSVTSLKPSAGSAPGSPIRCMSALSCRRVGRLPNSSRRKSRRRPARSSSSAQGQGRFTRALRERGVRRGEPSLWSMTAAISSVQLEGRFLPMPGSC